MKVIFVLLFLFTSNFTNFDLIWSKTRICKSTIICISEDDCQNLTGKDSSF